MFEKEVGLKDTKFQCEFIPWSRAYQLSRQLAMKIRTAGFQPDVIVAIARGGYVPARILCDFFDIDNLISMRVAHYGAGGRKKRSARLSVPLTTEVAGLRVLVVDDLIDTGDTLKIALDHIKDSGASEVKSAALLCKKDAAIEPDYYVQKIIKWRWVLFQWAAIEDLTAFIKKMGKMPAGPDAAAVQLEKEYSLKVPRQVLKDVYSLMR